MEYIELTCSYCKKPFLRRSPNYHTNVRKQQEIFCSRKCAGDSQTRTVFYPCAYCQTNVCRTLAEFKKSKSGNVFCNRSCSASYNNLHKTTGCRRSKLEIYLESQIQSFYSELGCIYNSLEMIGYELDFYFPTLRFAIELNGFLHYEPIYGPDKLERIQKNDNQKILLCQEKGIELCVIDSSSCKHLTQIQKDKYWGIVKQLISSIYSRHLT